MEKKMNNKGFSLVELIVVIAIMAVLVGVLAPQFIKYVEKSRESTDIQNADSVKTVVESYYSDKEGVSKNVVITIDGTATSTNDTDSDSGLSDAGVQNNKLKSSKWDNSRIRMEYNTSTGQWTLSGNEADYYEVSGNAFTPKP